MLQMKIKKGMFVRLQYGIQQIEVYMDKKVVFIGLATIDHTYLLDTFPRENTKIFASNYMRQFGGPALNAAITFNNLSGTGARFISYFGSSEPMIKAKDEVRSKFHLDVIDLINGNGYQVPESSVFTCSGSGTRTIVNPPRRDYDFKEDICFENLTLEEASVILLDGFVFSDQAKKELLKARKRGAVIVFDGGSWKNETLSILDTVDIAICSSRFLMPGHDRGQTISLMFEKGVEFIAITNDENDVDVFEGNSTTKIPVPRVNAIDTLGAGDVLHGAFCYYLNEGLDRKKALRQAAQIASRSCCYFGTHTWKEHEHERVNSLPFPAV
jgi:sugar/nucleoside kinase (ribokinase family)